MSPIRLFVPIALSLLAACATQPKQNVTVEKQSECPVRLTTGQNLIVMLPSNP
ncbi:MAG: peptidase inhibitor I42, partial [Pseudomonas sp.]